MSTEESGALLSLFHGRAPAHHENPHVHHSSACFKTEHRCHHGCPPVVPFPRNRDSTKAPETILPKWVYIRDRHGRYLTARSGPVYATLTFRSGDPNLDCAFQTIRTSSSWFRFLARDGHDITRYYSDPGWYSTDSQHTMIDNVITASGNKVYLKDIYSPARFISDELTANGAPLGHDYINESSEMEIIQAAVKNEIIDIKYDINGAKDRDAAPLIAKPRSAERNDIRAPNFLYKITKKKSSSLEYSFQVAFGYSRFSDPWLLKFRMSI